MPSLTTLAAQSIPDPELRAVALRAMTAAQLAMEKAVAHTAEPARYPLPSDARSIERLFLSRFEALDRSVKRNAAAKVLPRLAGIPAQRRARYGDLAELRLDSAVAMQEQVRKGPLPANLRPAAAALRARYGPLLTSGPARTGATGNGYRGGVPSRTRGGYSGGVAGGGGGNGELILRLHSVHCQEKTKEFLEGQDDIYLAGFRWQFSPLTKTVIQPFKVADFKKDEIKRYNPPRPFASIPVRVDRDSELVGGVSFVLAEKDLMGGLGAYLNSPSTLPDRELVGEIASALLGLIAGVAGVAAGFALAGPAGLLLAPLAAFVVSGLTYLIAEIIPGWIKDEIFPEALVATPVTFDGKLLGGRTVSETLDEPFTAFGGKYVVTYDWQVKNVTPTMPPPPRPTPFPIITEQQALANLQKIDHVVVLMLENRSFDHMLGYLSLEGGRTDVDGLRAGMSNTLTSTNKVHPIHHLDGPVFQPDPPHGHNATKRQVGDDRDMSGFVDEFFGDLESDPGKVMGYHNAADVPVYDFLAREFTVCQRWFSSAPGSTWVNRLFAMAGQSFGETNNRNPPIYDAPTFFRHLDAHNVSWKCYAHDIATLRAVDGHYRIGHGAHFDFVRRFFEDAAAGTLPAVSWIDPNFMDLGDLGDIDVEDPDEADNTTEFPTLANDDHPPVDIRHAQTLVLNLLLALVNSPVWDKTLFLVLYDEHGGMFDHVPPFRVPNVAQVGGEEFDFYGVRVPALVASPWVPRCSVSSIVFDHTSIISTILQRFCRGANGSVPSMSNRADHAAHLGLLLTESKPRGDSTRSGSRRALPVLNRRLVTAGRSGATGYQGSAGRPAARSTTTLTDLQRDIEAIKAYLRAQGQPAGVA